MKCKILEIGPDDMLRKKNLVGKQGYFERDEHKSRRWLSGWFYFDDIKLYFLQVRIEPTEIWSE